MIWNFLQSLMPLWGHNELRLDQCQVLWWLTWKSNCCYCHLNMIAHSILLVLRLEKCFYHYSDVIMTTIASQITSFTIVYSIVYSDADQRKHQSSASLAFVWGIHRWPVNSQHKRPVTRKCFHLMTSSWLNMMTHSTVNLMLLSWLLMPLCL